MASDAAAQKVEDQSKAKVFMSYSRKDMAFADRLDAELKARGFDPLIDRTDIYAFEEWWKRIEALISRADTVVFVMSPDAVTRYRCYKRGCVRRLTQQAPGTNRIPSCGGQIRTGSTRAAELHFLR